MLALERSAFLERLAVFPGVGRWTAYQCWGDLGEAVAEIERRAAAAGAVGEKNTSKTKMNTNLSLSQGGASMNKSSVDNSAGLGLRYLDRLVYAGPGTVEAIKTLEKKKGGVRVLAQIDEDNYGRRDHQAALCRGIALLHAQLVGPWGSKMGVPLRLSSGATGKFRLPPEHSVNDTEFLLCEFRKWQLRNEPGYKIQANKMYIKDPAERERIKRECYK